VVTRKVRQTDPSISDEKARSALGALGLIGEKAIRKVGHLSGTDSDLYCCDVRGSDRKVKYVGITDFCDTTERCLLLMMHLN
jgi:hypothetical protein